MKTPYEILEVAEHASDIDIKQAYLQKVKLNPPDRDHEKFQQLHNAYETLKNAENRTKYALFHYLEADFNALLDQALRAVQSPVMDAGLFDKLLRAGINDAAFLAGHPNKDKST